MTRVWAYRRALRMRSTCSVREASGGPRCLPALILCFGIRVLGSQNPHPCAMTVTIDQTLVSVVDDDESVRESLPDLLAELGFAPQAFASAHDFLSSDYVGATRCL